MTKEESNSGITVLSNPDRERKLLHFVLFRVDGGIVVHHSGAYGPMQGIGWINGARALPDEQVALYAALDAGLIAIGAPAVTGNPVGLTRAGEKRLAALNASAVLVSAA